MSINELESKARELRQLQALIEEARQEAEAIKDTIKAILRPLWPGSTRITWKSVTTARIDTSALKKALPEVAAAFTRETTIRRFCVA